MGTLIVASLAVRFRHRGLIILVGAAGMGLGLAIFSQSPGLGLAMPMLAAVGFSNTFYLTQVTSYTNQNGNQYSLYRSWSQINGVVTINVTFPLVQGLDNRKVAPRAYPQKTDIQWQFQSSGTSQIGAQIEGYLIQGT